MTKTLFKKQMMELFSFFWQDKKKNKNRTGIRLILSVLLYLGIFGILAAMFYFLADLLCEPLTAANMSWLYFSITGIIGVIMGAFGSVFNTYASLYSAKDNDFLLAMPIPPSRILLVRLSGVYTMGLFYELLVMIPVLMKYYLAIRPDFTAVICSILVTLVLSVFVLILSAVLGWAVALISAKTKHKSMVTVVLSLAFIVGYYYLYGKAAQFLQNIVANPHILGNRIQGRFSLLYRMGLAAEGDMVSFFWFSAVILGLFAIVYLILEKSYMKMVTANKGEKKTKYRERRISVRSADNALLGKEFRRFLGSPNYMLNCGLGILMMIVVAVALLIKAETVRFFLVEVFGEKKELIFLIAAAAGCIMTSMNDMTAPSVSLEGKSLWLVQVFPVSSWQVLMAKVKMHLILTLIPAGIMVISLEVVLKPSLHFGILIPLSIAVFILFAALLGLVLNLKMPNITWTNEIVPIKQSMCVMITLFGSWALVMAMAGIYWITRKYLEPFTFLLLATAILLGGALILLRWIKKKGTKVFETL
ncbi:MAG: hypothetical protein ACI4TF_10905 [Oliverpabstia sp.]